MTLVSEKDFLLRIHETEPDLCVCCKGIEIAEKKEDKKESCE